MLNAKCGPQHGSHAGTEVSEPELFGVLKVTVAQSLLSVFVQLGDVVVLAARERCNLVDVEVVERTQREHGVLLFGEVFDQGLIDDVRLA